MSNEEIVKMIREQAFAIAEIEGRRREAEREANRGQPIKFRGAFVATPLEEMPRREFTEQHAWAQLAATQITRKDWEDILDALQDEYGMQLTGWFENLFERWPLKDGSRVYR